VKTALDDLDVKVLRLQPNDAIVVTLGESDDPKEEAYLIHDQLTSVFPGNKVIVMSDGLQLEVVRPDA
jgi:hypothetical protein